MQKIQEIKGMRRKRHQFCGHQLNNLLINYLISGAVQNSSEDEPESPSRLARQLSSAFITIGSWFKEFQMYQIGLIYMSTRLFVNLSQAYIPLYIQVSI